MIDVRQLISSVQSTIGDLEGERFQREEYLTLLRQIGVTVSEATESWLDRFTIIPASTNPLTNTPLNQVVMPGVLNPFRLVHVWRQSGNDISPCQEISVQALNRQINTGYPFSINNVTFSKGAFAVNHDGTTNQINLVFTQPFVAGETCLIDYVVDNPMSTLTQWTSSTQAATLNFPNYLYDTLFYGLLWKVTERLMIQGDVSFAQTVPYSQQLFETNLRKAQGYNLMFKDKNSTLIMQPYIFLPDGDPF